MKLPEKIKVLTVTEIGRRAELCELPCPQLDDDSVLVRTHYSGVSIGTEMWIASGRRLEGRKVPFPAPGYQASGRIVAVGRAVTSFDEGDFVVGFCGAAHAQYVKIGKDYLHRLPDPDRARESALFVMPSVGAHALSQAEVNTGDSVLICGQGLIGQCTAQLARLRGAFVAASEVSPERIAISRRHCADWVIDASQGKLPDLIKERFPEGFDVVLESTGFQALLNDAMQCVRAGGFNKGGKFVFEGWYPDTITYSFGIPHARQMQCFYPAFIGERPNREGVLRLIASGKLEIAPLISHQVPWPEAAAVYTRLFTPERDRFNGIVLDWTAAQAAE